MRDDPPDEILLASVAHGDASAFEQLYERHRRPLFTFLLRFLGDRRLAEDLLQEAFLRVYRERGRYRPTARFRTWLYTIARNLALDHLRRRGQVAEIPDQLPAVPDPSPGPLEQIEAKDLVIRLEVAISKLPHSQREVLLLSRFAGLGHQEIAQIVGATPASVRVALHRALRALRALLASKE